MHRNHVTDSGQWPADRPEGLLPGLPLPRIAVRPSQRDALAAANGISLPAERARRWAQWGGAMLLAAVVLAIAVRG